MGVIYVIRTLVMSLASYWRMVRWLLIALFIMGGFAYTSSIPDCRPPRVTVSFDLNKLWPAWFMNFEAEAIFFDNHPYGDLYDHEHFSTTCDMQLKD
jgi:hypothetical protein